MNPNDEITDHAGDRTLDAAWQALDKGDVATARRRAERLGSESAEALLLLAACCREEGDAAGAMGHLRRAIAIDPEWASPELWLAELLLQGLHDAQDAEDNVSAKDIEEALRHAARALDLADDEPEYLSALALKAGLEAELGRVDDARETLADLPPPEVALGDPDAALEISDLHLALGDGEIARARLRTLTASEPDFAEAWHALGAAASDLGDAEEMRTAWKRTWALDAAPSAGGEVPRRLSDAEVTAIADQALEELPPRAQELLRGIPIVIAELPAEADVETGVDPRSMGLFSGTPHPEYSHLGGQPGLTQILLFRRNIERVAATDEDLREEIRVTLLHETGHFFGLDDAELEEAGLG